MSSSICVSDRLSPLNSVYPEVSKGAILRGLGESAGDLRISDYAWVMENGNVSLNGTGEELINNSDVKKAYLGL